MQEGSVSTLQCLPSQHSVIVIAIVACDDSVIALRIVFGHAIPTRKLVGNACMSIYLRASDLPHLQRVAISFR